LGRRLEAINQSVPKKDSDRFFAGGFSLALPEEWPPIVLKHLSQRSAFIRVTGAARLTRKEELGVSGHYLGRVLRGGKPMTEERVERLDQIREKTPAPRVSERSP
jgi:hypothetical protein